MKSLKKLIFSVVVLAFACQLKAQDPHFTQYFSNPLALNPAFTGSAGCSRIASSARYQWPKISGNYKTASISYDQYVHPMRSGLGFNFIFDELGNTIYNYSANFFYSYTIKIKNNLILKPAISLGFGAKHIDWSDLTFPDMIDPHNGIIFNPAQPPPDHNTQYYFNVGTGLIFSYRNLVLGFAGDHLNGPDEGFFSKSRIPNKYSVHGSYQFDIKEIASISPTIIYMRQKTFEQMLANVLFKVWYIKFGIGSRFNFKNADCVIGMVGFQNNWMSIGYSYDYTVSKLTNATGGAHELSMMYKFNCKNKTDKFHIPQINGF
jgi:type IX secretion system PorP/SprF family membrane protein